MLAIPNDLVEPPSRTQSRVALSLVVMLTVVAVAVFTVLQIDTALERARTVESDNRTWVLAQIEVDLQNLHIAMLRSQDEVTPKALEEIRLLYDILYSRITLVERAPTLNEVSLRDTAAWGELAGQNGLIQTILPFIDGEDADLAAQMPTILGLVADIRPRTREQIVRTLGESMRLGDQTRQDLRGTLYTFMGALVVALIGLTMLLVTIYRQARAQQSYARMLELAVYNLRATIESARDAVLIVDAQDRVIASNAAGERMLGKTPSLAVPTPLAEVLLPPEVQQDGLSDSSQMLCLASDGQRIPVEVTIATTATGAGHAVKIAFLRDMTQQLLREQELARAMMRAREGEEAKDRFLAVMSHEMRTPLSGLLSATDLVLTTTRLDSQQAWLIDIVRSCGLAALEQVNNILELTRLAAHGPNDYPQSEFCVADAVRELAQQYQALALGRGNRLDLRLEDGCNCLIHAPLPLLRRILNNLLSNAIKFTHDGVITLQLSCAPTDQPGLCRFVLCVSDTGVGIQAQDLKRIFHNFETLDSSYARTQEGTGLGLGIAKLAAEALGGAIDVESAVGKGSRFTVTFVAKVLGPVAKAAPAPVAEQADHMPLRILLAEDNEVNCLLMQRQLGRLGHSVTTASDGLEAIAAVEQDKFDIILMDISMPRLDGLTATQMLRDRGLLVGTPVIALTAQASANRVEMLRAAGMTEVVTKPAPVAQLDKLMQTLVAQATFVPPNFSADGDLGLLDDDHLSDLIEDVGPDLLDAMSKRFGDEMQVTLVALRQALAADDRQKLAAVAHKAAGAAAVLTLRSLAQILRSMETGAEAEAASTLASSLDRLEGVSRASLARLRQRLDQTLLVGRPKSA